MIDFDRIIVEFSFDFRVELGSVAAGYRNVHAGYHAVDPGRSPQ